MNATIALCLRQDRISPRYDQADRLLFVTVDAERREVSRRFLDVEHMPTEEMCRMLTQSGIALMVCGGIREDCQQNLSSHDIPFMENIIGSLEAVLDQYARGELQPGMLLD